MLARFSGVLSTACMGFRPKKTWRTRASGGGLAAPRVASAPSFSRDTGMYAPIYGWISKSPLNMHA